MYVIFRSSWKRSEQRGFQFNNKVNFTEKTFPEKKLPQGKVFSGKVRACFNKLKYSFILISRTF
jgi:hypothetical protein